MSEYREVKMKKVFCSAAAAALFTINVIRGEEKRTPLCCRFVAVSFRVVSSRSVSVGFRPI